VTAPPRLPGPLVDGAWLERNLRRVRIADVRWYRGEPSGREAHRAGHIPGAVWVDADRDLAGPATPEGGRHPLPAPERFAAAMAALGIGDRDAVVAYDDASGSIAARLWWMLRAVGVEAAVLDGGLQAWRGPLETGAPDPAPATFAPRRWPARSIVDTAAIEQLRRDPDALVLDARAAARFTGEIVEIDPRGGHIPGARSAPWSDNVEPASGRLHDATELRRRYEAKGAGDAATVVTYCGSGITACHDLLALAVAGFEDGVLYPGSWSAWSADPERPAALGDE
jgi:thiosulfate/3-mercaptopyruvate sulfurtransferase